MQVIGETNSKKGIPASIQERIAKFIVICAFLGVINGITSPHYWWVLWIVFGWGLTLMLQIISWYYGQTKSKEGKQ